jgi:hypothetical protein
MRSNVNREWDCVLPLHVKLCSMLNRYKSRLIDQKSKIYVRIDKIDGRGARCLSGFQWSPPPACSYDMKEGTV